MVKVEAECLFKESFWLFFAGVVVCSTPGKGSRLFKVSPPLSWSWLGPPQPVYPFVHYNTVENNIGLIEGLFQPIEQTVYFSYSIYMLASSGPTVKINKIHEDRPQIVVA